MRFLFCLLLLNSSLLSATPTVTDVTAKQRYPWNGLVDISCKVSGIEGTTNGIGFTASAIVPDLGITNRISNIWVMRDGEKSTDFAISTNGNYHLLWDAKADLGAVRYTNMVVAISAQDTTKVQLWEGGPYWATTNIGADEPWDYGYYFWWGDTIGYKRVNNAWVASDGSSSSFSFSTGNTPTYGKSTSTLQSEGWITSDGVLAPEHDAATVHWGGNWRMPTMTELNALNSNCTWVWTTTNGVSGYVVSGKGDYAANSIFLPCAGYGYGTSLYYAGSLGSYWSSVPGSDSRDAWRLFFNSSSHSTSDYGYYGRGSGQSVRPVQGFTE